MLVEIVCKMCLLWQYYVKYACSKLFVRYTYYGKGFVTIECKIVIRNEFVNE